MRLLLLALSCLAIVPAVPAASDDYLGSAACAACHAAIYRRYSATPMALSSGRVAELSPGGFYDSRSGVRYRVFQEQKQWLFEFTKSAGAVRGRRSLDFFVGSGAAGRSYLIQIGGFLFQAPVSWYARPARWDVSPGFERDETINLTRPIETECLDCHASRLQPVEGTQNGYQAAPFLEDGIGCERCHGPGKNHVAKAATGRIEGSREIVNPARLTPPLRDSVCAQCHLTGVERVEKAGGGLGKFRPGNALSDFIASFIWPDNDRPGLRVTSHYEKLWQSRCKKAGGDRLWCGTCHDPHSVPVKAQRSEFYRGKCLSCHPVAHSQPRDKGRAGDCISCHMPAGEVVDAAHAVFTDHSIPRFGAQKRPAAPGPAERTLAPFWGEPANPRELGMAYLRLANRQHNAADLAWASMFLKKAEAAGEADPGFLTQLAYLYDREGNEEKAAVLYERASRSDPGQAEAAVNLGSILFKRGRTREAIRAWEAALSANPGLDAARINLALAHLRAGNRASARAVLLVALEYSPDLAPARKLLAELDGRGVVQ